MPISFRIFQFIVIYTVKGFGIVNKAVLLSHKKECILVGAKMNAKMDETRAYYTE